MEKVSTLNEDFEDDLFDDDDEMIEDNKIEDVPEWFPELSKFERVGLSIGSLVLEKNKRYGDSALNPLRIFSQLSNEEGLKVRIDDKLSRIKNSHPLRKNDVADLIGYLILYSLSQKWEDFSALID